MAEKLNSSTPFIFRNPLNEENSQPVYDTSTTKEVWVFQAPQVKQNAVMEPLPGTSKMSEAENTRLASDIYVNNVMPSCSKYLDEEVVKYQNGENTDAYIELRRQNVAGASNYVENSAQCENGNEGASGMSVDYNDLSDNEQDIEDIECEEPNGKKMKRVTYEFDFMRLPLDMKLYVLQFLSVADIRNVMLTCKWLHQAIRKDNYLWKRVTKKKFVIYSNPNAGANILSWYDRNRITYNWLKGYYETKIMMKHNQNYMSWLTLCNARTLVISLGFELRCYPLDKNDIPITRGMFWNEQVPIVKRYDIRTNDISRFVIKSGLIVCGNRDGCVSIYRAANIRRRPQLIAHIKDCHKDGSVEVSAVELVSQDETGDNAFAITASGRSTKINFWTCPPDITQSPTTPMGGVALQDGSGVRCLAVNQDGDLLAAGPNGNNRGFVFDIDTGKLLVGAMEEGTMSQAVRDIGWHDPNTIMYVTHGGVLQLLDIRTGDVVFGSRDPFLSTLYCVKSDHHNAIFVGASEYSRTVLFDARNSSNYLQLYFTQKKFSPTYSMDYDTSKLIVAADRSVAALDFNVTPGTVPCNDYSYAFELVYR